MSNRKSVSVSRCVLTGRTFLTNFIPIRFEKQSLIIRYFLQRSPQEEEEEEEEEEEKEEEEKQDD